MRAFNSWLCSGSKADTNVGLYSARRRRAATAAQIICEVTGPLVLAFNQLGDALLDMWTHGCTMSCSDIAN